MKRRVELTPDARQDSRRLGVFLIDKNPRAAMEAMRAVREATLSLAHMAERGRSVGGSDLRELVVRVGGGPYIIEYRVDTAVVVVSHIWHAREDRRGLTPDAG